MAFLQWDEFYETFRLLKTISNININKYKYYAEYIWYEQVTRFNKYYAEYISHEQVTRFNKYYAEVLFTDVKQTE